MKSFLSYLGGKSLLAGKIVPKIPEHTCYCEVFAGAAWMLFKKEPSKVEIINDINSDLVTLYRVVKNHLEEFIRYLKWILVARDEFERFVAENPETLTDIQRAVRFYYLIRSGYASRIPHPTISVSTMRQAHFNIVRLEEELSIVYFRLARVYVENKPFEQIIARYDKPHTFFYLDPPYYGCEDYYGNGIFCREDYKKLRDLLTAAQGKFIMSINDVPEIRKLFGEFHIEKVGTSYSVAGANKKQKVNELLIMNYTPAVAQ